MASSLGVICRYWLRWAKMCDILLIHKLKERANSWILGVPWDGIVHDLWRILNKHRIIIDSLSPLLSNCHIHVFNCSFFSHEAWFNHGCKTPKEKRRNDNQRKQCRLHNLSAISTDYWVCIIISKKFLIQGHRETECNGTANVRCPHNEHYFSVCQFVFFGSFAAFKCIIRYKYAERPGDHHKYQLS